MDYHRTSVDEVLPEGQSFPGRPATDLPEPLGCNYSRPAALAA